MRQRGRTVHGVSSLSQAVAVDEVTPIDRPHTGASPDMTEQSWHIFGYGVVSWLGGQQDDHDYGGIEPRFDLFLGALLRGLPAQEPGIPGHKPRPQAITSEKCWPHPTLASKI